MSRWQERIVFGTAAILVLAACQRHGQEDTTQGKASPSASVAIAVPSSVPRIAVESSRGVASEQPVGIKVLELGTEPRKLLRYSFKKGRSHKLALVQENRVKVKVGTEQMPPTDVPPIRTVMQWDVTDTDSETASIAFKVLSAKVEGKSSDPIVAQVEQMLADFKAFRGHQRTDSRGALLDFELDSKGANNPQLTQMLDSIKQSLGQMVAPLPEEAVGVGAKWQVTSRLEQFGLKLTQRATYTVTGVDAQGVQADVVLEQSSPPGKVAPPGMPEGVSVNLLAFDSKGSGKSHIDFRTFVSMSNTDLVLAMKMHIPEGSGAPVGGQTVEMDMNMSMKIVREK